MAAGRAGLSSAQSFDHHRHALTAADAHRLEAERGVGLLQVVDQGGHDAGAGHAERVAERDRAAVDVELGDLARGRTITDWYGDRLKQRGRTPDVDVAVGVDADAFDRVLVDAILSFK